MKTLQELSILCSKQDKILDALVPQATNSPLRKLYEYIRKNNTTSEIAAMTAIYGKKNVVAFSRLKSRLKEIYYLALSLTHRGEKESIDRFDEVTWAYRNTLVARILNNRRADELKNELLEKSITKSIKYNLTENILAQIRMLIVHHASISTNEYKINKYKINKYFEIQNKYLKTYEWEIKSENYYFDIHRNQSQSLATISEHAKEKALQYYTEINSVTGIRSFNFNYNKFRIIAAYFEYTKKYYELLSLTENALREFSAPDLRSDAVLSSINIRKLWALIQAENFNVASEIGLSLLQNEIPGSNSWYRLGYYTLKSLLYNEEYTQASILINSLISHPYFDKLSDYYSEIFYTSLGYIHLIVDSEIDNNSKEIKTKLPEFKLGKFLNTNVVFNKDKRGINVSILLLNIAFLLQRRDYSAIIDRTDSLNQYAYRYLRKDDSFRSNCIIKMVIQMTKADFNLIRTQRYTNELSKQLNQVKLAGSGENIEIEIIPFEKLWSLMLLTLD